MPYTHAAVTAHAREPCGTHVRCVTSFMATAADRRLHLRDPLNQSLMYKTATTQVNLDYGSEGDMVDKMRAGACM